MDRRRTLVLLGALYLITAAAHGWLLSGVRVAPYIAHDEVQYCMIGENIRAGNGFVMRGAFASTAPPLYPLFVALGHSMPGDPRVGLYVLSVLIISLLLFPAYLLARELGLGAALSAAAAFAATFLPQTFYAGMYMSETLQLPLFLLAFWLCLRWLRSGTLVAGVLLGGVFGVMALNRFATFTFFSCFLIAAIAAVLLPAISRFQVSRPRAAMSLALALAGMAIFQGGWWAYKVFHGANALGSYANTSSSWGRTALPLFIAYLADAFLAPGLIVLAPFCAGLRRLWSKQPPAALLIAAVLVTLVCTTALSDGSQTGFLRERYFLYCFPLIFFVAILGAREYFTAAPGWMAGLMLLTLPVMCLFGLMLYDFHVPALVEASWAHATGTLSLSGKAAFSPSKLLANGLLLIAAGSAICIALRRQLPAVVTAWVLLFNVYTLARVSRDIAEVTRGIAVDTAPLIDLLPPQVKPLQKVIVTGFPPGWDDRSIPQTPRFPAAAAAAGLTADRIWYLETMKRLDVRMCASPYCVLDPAAAGTYLLTPVEFPNLQPVSTRGPFHLYRIPPRAAAAAGPPLSIPAREFIARPDRKLDGGVYKLRWLLTAPASLPVRAEVATLSQIIELEEGPANALRDMRVVADPSASFEFRIRGPRRPDLIFRGVELQPEPIDGRLAVIEYGQTLPPAQFLTRIGERLPEGALASRGRAGFLCYGPYRKLPAGKYKVIFNLHSARAAKVHCDVAADGIAIAAADGFANAFPPLEFSSDGRAAFEYRVVTTDTADVTFDGAKVLPLE